MCTFGGVEKVENFIEILTFRIVTSTGIGIMKIFLILFVLYYYCDVGGVMPCQPCSTPVLDLRRASSHCA